MARPDMVGEIADLPAYIHAQQVRIPFEQGFHVPIELGDGDDPRRFGFPDILHSRLPGIVRFYVTAIYPFRPDLTAASSAIPAALSAE